MKLSGKSLLVGLVLACVVPAIHADQPQVEITATGRTLVMNSVGLTASVQSAGLPVTSYTWGLERPNDHIRLTSTNQQATILELWSQAPGSPFNAGAAEVLVGRTVGISLTVVFQDPEGGEVVATAQRNLQIEGVLSPPDPVIGGNLGTQTDRRPCGEGCNIGVDAWQSTDADNYFQPTWTYRNFSGSGSPVVFQSGKMVATIQVPRQTRDSHLDVVLWLEKALHRVERFQRAYLSGATSTGENRAPTLSVSPSSVSVAQGQTLTVVATATDLDGDDLTFTWIGLSNSTINPPFVTSQRVSSTQWRSTLNHPTGAVPLGTHQFTVQASEVGTSPALSSATRTVSVTVGGGGGGGGGVPSAPPPPDENWNVNRATCNGNRGPVLVSINPDPRQSAIHYSAGQAARVEVVFSDDTTVDPGGVIGGGGVGVLTGVPKIEWDTTALEEKGVAPNATLQATADPKERRSILEFTVPASQLGESLVSATAYDQEDCSTTITFGVTFVELTPAPQATIRYRLEPSGGYITPGASVETSARTIYLDASASTGSGTLSYTWAATGISDATLSSGSATQPTLSIPQGATGTVTVSLTAADQEGRSHSISLLFNITEAPTQPETVLNFSQVAVGRIDSQRRFETAVVLVNDSDDEEASGEMAFTNALGGDWVILIDGEPAEELDFTIIPGGAREFTLRGEDIEFGWMSVTSNIPLAGHLFYRVVDQNDRILREVPILPVWGYSFRTALGAGAHEFVAVALVNLGENATRFRIVAREDVAPDSPYPTRWIELGPGEHMARYLSELYNEHSAIGDFPPGFLGGSVIVESDDPSGRLGATIIRTTEDGLPLSILPVATRR